MWDSHHWFWHQLVWIDSQLWVHASVLHIWCSSHIGLALVIIAVVWVTFHLSIAWTHWPGMSGQYELWSSDWTNSDVNALPWALLQVIHVQFYCIFSELMSELWKQRSQADHSEAKLHQHQPLMHHILWLLECWGQNISKLLHLPHGTLPLWKLSQCLFHVNSVLALLNSWRVDIRSLHVVI